MCHCYQLVKRHIMHLIFHGSWKLIRRLSHTHAFDKWILSHNKEEEGKWQTLTNRYVLSLVKTLRSVFSPFSLKQSVSSNLPATHQQQEKKILFIEIIKDMQRLRLLVSNTNMCKSFVLSMMDRRFISLITEACCLFCLFRPVSREVLAICHRIRTLTPASNFLLKRQQNSRSLVYTAKRKLWTWCLLIFKSNFFLSSIFSMNKYLIGFATW